MKKYILFTLLVLMGCTQISSINIPTLQRERNENCMDFKRFQVFQVFDDGYALANACTSEYSPDSCYGAVVLLTPRRNLEYYDEMYVSTPNDKCAVQNGVYKYETKNKTHKTVPVIRLEYEFSSSSEQEDMERINDTMEDLRFECKLSVTNNKNTKANINKCDCAVDFISSEVLRAKSDNLTAADKENIEKNLLKNIEKKCGKLPDFLKDAI